MSATKQDIANLQQQMVNNFNNLENNIVGVQNNLQSNQNGLQDQIIKNSTVQFLNLEQQNLLSNVKYNDTLALLVTDTIVDTENIDFAGVLKSNYKVSSSNNIYDYVTNVELFRVLMTFENVISLIANNINEIQISGLFCEYNVETDVLERVYIKSKLAYSNLVQSETGEYLEEYVINKNTIMSSIVDENLKVDGLEYNLINKELKNYMVIALNEILLILSDVSDQKNLLKNITLPDLSNNRILFRNYSQNFEPNYKPINKTGNYNVSIGTGGSACGVSVDIAKHILSLGGNAVDALVTISFVSSLNHSALGFFGGAGFINFYRKSDNKALSIDCREALSENYPVGLEWPGAGGFSTISTGVLGFLKGLHKLFENYGSQKFTFSELIQPAINIAKLKLKLSYSNKQSFIPNSLVFKVDDNLTLLDSNKFANNFFTRDGELKNLLDTDNADYRANYKLQIDLFKNIQTYGIDYFYKSKVDLGLTENTFADKFVETLFNQTNIKKYDSQPTEEELRPYLPTLNDLKIYQALTRPSHRVNFKLGNDDISILAHPSPCSSICGAFIIKLVFMSGAIINNDLQYPGTLYRICMINNLGWVYRGFIAGDYDNLLNTDVLNTFVTYMKDKYNLDFDTSGITTNEQYYEYLTSDETVNKFVNFLQAQPDWQNAANLSYPTNIVQENNIEKSIENLSTNNIVVYDEDISISFNNSLNSISGNKFTVDGILINNELYDFPDIGTRGINDPGPSRRPASSQSPLIVLINGEPSIITGGAGGFKIYQHAAWKIINLLNEIQLQQSFDIDAGKVTSYIPLYASFGFIVTNEQLPISIIETVVSNNTNNYFGGSFTNSLADSKTMYINPNNKIITAIPEQITYNNSFTSSTGLLINYNYTPNESCVVNKLN